MIRENNSVIIAKNKAPAIFFVVTHPNMIRAFEQFVVPVKEEAGK